MVVYAGLKVEEKLARQDAAGALVLSGNTLERVIGWIRLLSRSHLRIILVMQGYLLEEILHCCRSYRIILFFIVCVATCH